MRDQIPKDKKERKISNELTWPRRVMLQWLRSFFRHHPDFKYREDPKKTEIIVVEGGVDLDQYKENVDRVIVTRRTFNAQNIVTDNRVYVDNDMYTYSIIKPKLGYIDIFCESINQVQCEYIATLIDTSLMMHKEDLLKMNVGISGTTMGDLKQPYSGSNFNSMVVSVPTIVVSNISYSVKDPRMLQQIEIEFGIENSLDFKVES